MQNDDRLIVEVSKKNYADYCTLKKYVPCTKEGAFFYYFTDGCNHHKNGSCMYNFCFIDQDSNTLNEIVTGIVNNTSKTKICIAVHKTGNPIDAVSKGIRNSTKIEGKVIYPPKEFIHENNDPLWKNGLEPFVVESIGNNFYQYKDLFNNLWNLLAPSQADIAHTFRADILTPFIPFHLYHDPDNNKTEDWNTILEDCCTAINAKDKENKNIIEDKFNMLIGLKGSLSDETKNSAREAFKTLKDYFQTDGNVCVEKAKVKDCRETIESFAESLGKIVNSIEDSKEK